MSKIIFHPKIYLHNIIIILGAWSLVACANVDKDGVINELTLSDSRESSLYLLPDQAYGVIYVESPKSGNLFQLHGTVGKGVAVLRERNQTRCFVKTIKIAAGGFDGKGISINKSEPIRLIVYSENLAETLLSGEEVVSDTITVKNRLMLSDPGDILIESGLGEEQGFVLNPSEWSLFNLFGTADNSTVSCVAENEIQS